MRCRSCDLRPNGSPPITRLTLPACHAHYPGEPNRGACRLLACSCCLPLVWGGSAFALALSRPARASLALQPAGLLSCHDAAFVTRLRSTSCPTEPLVSYRTNRQLSVWSLPPLIRRAVGAHPRDFAVRVRHVRPTWHPRPSHPRPTVRDDRPKRPSSSRRDAREADCDLPDEASGCGCDRSTRRAKWTWACARFDGRPCGAM